MCCSPKTVPSGYYIVYGSILNGPGRRIICLWALLLPWRECDAPDYILSGASAGPGTRQVGARTRHHDTCRVPEESMRCVQSERGKCGSASPDVPKQEIDLMRPCGQPPGS